MNEQPPKHLECNDSPSRNCLFSVSKESCTVVRNTPTLESIESLPESTKTPSTQYFQSPLATITSKSGSTIKLDLSSREPQTHVEPIKPFWIADINQRNNGRSENFNPPIQQFRVLGPTQSILVEPISTTCDNIPRQELVHNPLVRDSRAALPYYFSVTPRSFGLRRQVRITFNRTLNSIKNRLF